MPQTVHRIRELRARRAQIAEEIRSVRTSAGTNPLSAEQRTKIDGLFAEAERLRVEIVDEERQMELERDIAGDGFQEGRGRSGNGGADGARSADGDDADDEGDDEAEGRSARSAGDRPERRSGDRGGDRGGRREERAGVQTLHRDLTRTGARRDWRSILTRTEFRSLASNRNDREAREYAENFVRYLRTGERRELQAGTDPEGGFLVAPMQFSARFLQLLDDTVWMRSLATVETVTGTDTLGMLSLDSDPDDPEWTSELKTGNTDDAVKFGRRQWKTHPLARRIRISKTLLRRTGFDVESLVIRRLARKKAVVEERAFLLGSGVNQPLGIFVPSNDGVPTSRDVVCGSQTEYTYEGLVRTKYSLKEAYRTRARWLLPRTGVMQVATLTNDNGDALWQPGLQLGQPDRILGNPLNESEYVPNVFTASKYVGMFFDPTEYLIVDSLAMELQRLTELYAESNQIGYIMRAETEGGPTLAEAYARMTLSA